MNVVVACASFKGTLSSREAGEALAQGLADGGCQTRVIALADGGEGLVEALASQTAGATYLDAPCRGPLGGTVTARLALLPRGPERARLTAVLEMAASSGLPLVPHDECDALRATTWGVGDQILAALNAAAGDEIEILLGIGGSATNDGGAGMAQALGAQLLDSKGNELPPGGAALINLSRIDISIMNSRARATPVTVACDVRNPLCGPRGASRIFGPQKGATAQDVETLDAALAHYARIVKRDLGRDVADVPGAGAAGGLGAGCLAFLNATLKPGIDWVLDGLNFDAALADADWVLTGEGFLDEQTVMGKAPAGVAARAARRGIPCVAVGGGIDPSARVQLERTFQRLESLADLAGSVDEAKRNGAHWLRAMGRRLAAK